MRFIILEPKGAIWQGMVKKVNLPAQDGEMCVLDFHQPFVVRLRKGNIVFSNQHIAIRDGIAFMHSNNLTVFTQA